MLKKNIKSKNVKKYIKVNFFLKFSPLGNKIKK